MSKPKIKSTNAFNERVTVNGAHVEIPVVDVEFFDGRIKRYKTMPDGTVRIEETLDSVRIPTVK